MHQLRTKVTIAENQNQRTFIHLNYCGEAWVNKKDNNSYNTLVIPLADGLKHPLENFFREFNNGSETFMFATFGCDRDRNYEPRMAGVPTDDEWEENTNSAEAS